MKETMQDRVSNDGMRFVHCTDLVEHDLALLALRTQGDAGGGSRGLVNTLSGLTQKGF
jgi:hypothetical protein